METLTQSISSVTKALLLLTAIVSDDARASSDAAPFGLGERERRSVLLQRICDLVILYSLCVCDSVACWGGIVWP